MSKKVSGWPLIVPVKAGEGGIVYFPMSMTIETGLTTTATYEDVVTAIEAGKMVAFITSGERGGSMALVTDYMSRVGGCTVRATAPDGNIVFSASTETGPMTGLVETKYEIPEIESGDAGKVLTVNAGETGTEWAESSGGGDLSVYLIGDLMASGTATLYNLATGIPVAVKYNEIADKTFLLNIMSGVDSVVAVGSCSAQPGGGYILMASGCGAKATGSGHAPIIIVADATGANATDDVSGITVTEYTLTIST